MSPRPPPKRQHQPPLPAPIHHNQRIERQLAAAQRMEQAQPDEVIDRGRRGLDEGKREGRVGRESVRCRVVAEGQGLEGGRDGVEGWEEGAVGGVVRSALWGGGGAYQRSE